MRNRLHLIPAVVVTVMLLGAVAPMPEGYYNALRWVICAFALHLEIVTFQWWGEDSEKWWSVVRRNWVAAILFGCVAVLFNPLNPANLPRAGWILVDLLSSFLFAYTGFNLRKPPTLSDRGFLDWFLYILGTLVGGAWFTAFAFAGLTLLFFLLREFINLFFQVLP